MQYKRTKWEAFEDWSDDHLITFGWLVAVVGIMCLMITITICSFLLYKIDIAKLNEQARICVETGYGCQSNTQSTDIKYDNTPIVEMKNE